MLKKDLKESSKIYSEANRFFIDKGFESLFKNYGEVFFTGSYALNTMTWRDVDLQILPKKGIDPRTALLEILSFYFNDPHIIKSQFINFLGDYKPTMPRGLYLGMNFLSPSHGGNWKMDIWILNEKDFEKNRAFMNSLKALINDDLRNIILEIKYKLMGKDGRVPQGGSYYLLQLLLQGIRDKNMLLVKLKEKGYSLKED